MMAEVVLAIRMTPDRDEVAGGVCNDSPLRIGSSLPHFAMCAQYSSAYFNVHNTQCVHNTHPHTSHSIFHMCNAQPAWSILYMFNVEFATAPSYGML